VSASDFAARIACTSHRTVLFSPFVALNRFKFKTVTSGEFRDTFVSFVKDTLGQPEVDATVDNNKPKKKGKRKGKSELHTPNLAEISPENQAILDKVDALNWEQLFLCEGMPTFVPNFENSLSAVAQELAQKWIAHATDKVAITPAAKDIEGWGSAQLCLFLEAVINFMSSEADNAESIDEDFLHELDEAYGFTARQNAEVKLRWHSVCLRANVAMIVPHVVDFITSQGRMKFVRPLYSALRQSAVGGELAQRVFDEHKKL
jgi:hypothetical protein